MRISGSATSKQDKTEARSQEPLRHCSGAHIVGVRFSWGLDESGGGRRVSISPDTPCWCSGAWNWVSTPRTWGCPSAPDTAPSLLVGDFYFSRGGVFYPVNDALRRLDSPPLAELGLGRDPLNAALDGAQDAMAEMAVALAQSLLHPGWSNIDVRHTPPAR
jgi:hypothetical protein